mmetsp:Transcript_41617/g.119388  ORF Transcript_41617/g.119388 Transcript_41617/m.119388 type:complete len:283 (+) Transcript_41617:191-1039(+)
MLPCSAMSTATAATGARRKSSCVTRPSPSLSRMSKSLSQALRGSPQVGAAWTSASSTMVLSSRADWSSADSSRADWSRAERSRADWSRPDRDSADGLGLPSSAEPPVDGDHSPASILACLRRRPLAAAIVSLRRKKQNSTTERMTIRPTLMMSHSQGGWPGSWAPAGPATWLLATPRVASRPCLAGASFMKTIASCVVVACVSVVQVRAGGSVVVLIVCLWGAVRPAASPATSPATPTTPPTVPPMIASRLCFSSCATCSAASLVLRRSSAPMVLVTLAFGG